MKALDFINKLADLRRSVPLRGGETEVFKVELANKIAFGRAAGNLFGVARYLGSRRHTYVLAPQESEELARGLCATLNERCRGCGEPGAACCRYCMSDREDSNGRGDYPTQVNEMNED